MGRKHEQFLLFPQCFQKACFPGALKGVIVWEWVKKQGFVQESVSHIIFFLNYCEISICLWHSCIKSQFIHLFILSEYKPKAYKIHVLTWYDKTDLNRIGAIF